MTFVIRYSFPWTFVSASFTKIYFCFNWLRDVSFYIGKITFFLGGDQIARKNLNFVRILCLDIDNKTKT